MTSTNPSLQELLRQAATGACTKRVLEANAKVQQMLDKKKANGNDKH